MTERHRSHSRSSASHPGQAHRGANASFPRSQHGGALVPSVNSAFPTDQVLTGLQSPLSVMQSTSDQTPRNFFSAFDPNFQTLPGSFGSFSPTDFLQGDSQYTLSSSNSSIAPRYLDLANPTPDLSSVTSHQPAQQSTAPWSHLSATEGSPVDAPAVISPTERGKHQLLTPPRRGRVGSTSRPRAISSGSGRESFGDSAYGTGSRKSLHEPDTVSTGPSDIMQPSNVTPRVYSSSHSSTVTPSAFTAEPPSESGQTTTRQPPRRRSQLLCPECRYVAKTRSDLKKHRARHIREFKCHFQGCARSMRGFATSNDLDRHLKSVHHINNRKSRYWKCFADGCTKASKEWPRLDNFKQHLIKMHGEASVDALLERSNTWFDREEQGNPGSLDQGLDVLQASSGMTLQEQFSEFGGPFSPAPAMNFERRMPQANQMARSASYGVQVIDPNLAGMTTTPLLTIPQPAHRRRVSSPVPQRPFVAAPSMESTNNIAVPTMVQQRTRSQADQSPYQNALQMQGNFGDAMELSQYVPDSRWSSLGLPTPVKLDYPHRYAVQNDQIRKVKGPHTIAVPDLDTNRMAEFPSPLEPQSMEEHLESSQDDLLGFIGGSTVGESVNTVRSPHQMFQVTINPPEPAPKSGLEKRIEDEINTFLEQHRANAGNQAMTEEEIFNKVRLSLRSSDTMTSGGSSYISGTTGPTDTTEVSSSAGGGIKCPVTRVTYHPCTYPGCTKFKSRASELKKHMQRHSKPYGCTFDGCNKVFGSKNDWKRHEQGQHEQQECWRCNKCREVFFHDQSFFVDHMRLAHAAPRPEEYLRSSRIARNYQGQFWCGFCDLIIAHSKSGVEANNCRFDHIAHHFTKDDKSSMDWIELTQTGKTKKMLAESREQGAQGHSTSITEEEEEEEEILTTPQAFSETSQSAASSSQQSGELSPVEEQTFSQPLSKPSLPPRHITSHPQTGHSFGSADLTGLKMTGHGGSTNSLLQRHRKHQRPIRAEFVECCNCGMPSNTALGKFCINDEHEFCSSCSYGVATSEWLNPPGSH